MSFIRTSDGINIYVDDVGAGDTIVFAHEFGGDWRSWRPQVECFRNTHRCIRYCARGFLPSDVPENPDSYGQGVSTADLRSVVDERNLDQFHLVGLSMGSYTSLDFSLLHPGRVKTLTLVGCSSGPDEAGRAKYRKDLRSEIELLDLYRGDGAVDWFVNDSAYKRMPAKQSKFWTTYCDNLRAQSVAGARNTLSRLHWNRASLFTRGEALRKLRVSTLLAFGDEDHHLVEPTNEFLESVLPNARIAKFAKTGHLVNIENPERFNQTLERHIIGTTHGI